LVKYEIIDAWHFVMNQLLYLKYKPQMKLEELYDHAINDLKTGTIGTSDLHYLVGEFIEAVGELYQNSSYKDWKTYSTWKEDPLKIQELGDIMLIKFFKIFVAINLTPDQIYQFYYNKNIENVERQKVGGRYEK
ncbi:MAG: dUTP diphosphatase, partial [Methanobrevibacter sp.]|nr:dUTP diphosphatase [Methanobrevibacter sp.]